MKQIIMKYMGGSALLAVLLLSSCEVDTLKEVEGLAPVVSLVQVEDGNVALKPDNLIIDKTNQLFRKGFGLALSGFTSNAGFSAALELDYTDVPEGCVKLSAAECYLTSSEESVEKITDLTVPAGVRQKAFYLNITRAALEAHEGDVIAVKLKVRNLSGYELNKLDSAYITMNTTEFGSKKINLTDKYFLNPTFKRQDGTTTRFANLQDWKANAAVTESRAEGAGYDQNCGYLGIERWGSWDNPIINGKIYQSFELPKGRYKVEVDMKKVAPERDTYIVAATGNKLPDDTGIGTAIASIEITAGADNKLLELEFTVDQPKLVSIGFLINIDEQTQRILQASAIRLFQLESFFD